MTKTSPPSSPETSELPTGPGVAFTFIYYFSGASLIAALFTAKTLGVGFGNPITGEFALIGGSLAGLVAVFFNRTKTLEIPFTSRKTFLRELETTLAEMGYTLTETIDGISQYQRSPFQRWFSGDIYVQIREQSAALVSRAVNVRTLKKRLGD
ncbi:MAG: hypothetical protein AAFX01_01285 [Cyanobacteria bacterium J06638_28]